MEIPSVVQAQESPPPPPPSLGHTTARGFSWLLVNSITIKVATLIQTILVGKLLIDQDYGLVSIVFTIGGLSAMISSVSIDDMLVQRQRELYRWATPAFWVSLTLALAGATVMFIATPVAEWAYRVPNLFGLVFVTALAVPISNLQHVPNATLRSQLRYRTLAIVSWSTSMFNAGLTVLMAWRGYGAYSIMGARTISLGAQTATLWILARPRLRLELDLPQWPSLMGDGRWLMGVRVWNQLILNGGYGVLLVLYNKAIAGTYFFASNLSTTTTALLALNMGGVLMASLCKLQDNPRRQVSATLRAAGAIALLGFPLSFMQAAGSGPIMRLIWHEKWVSAIPVLQFLSVGMVFQVLAIPGTNLLMAQARYRTLYYATLANMLIFFGLVIPGAMAHQAVGVSIGGGIAQAVIDIGMLYRAIRPGGGTWSDIIKPCAAPFTFAAIATAAGAVAGHFVPAIKAHIRVHYLMQLATIGLVTLGIYLPLMWKFAPDQVADFLSRALPLLPSWLRPRPVSAAPPLQGAV